MRLCALTLCLSASAASAAGDLEGTAWRLLNISSMDDTVHVPDDPGKYTLSFGADGHVAMRADCNRGTGTWSSESANRLSFGPVAATRALCPPPSLSEKYLAQFQWVRSYTMKDGHLFLATMADGSIIEFEPLPPVVATVLGEEVRASEAAEMQAVIVTRLLDRYAADQGIEVEDVELDAFLDHMRRGMAAEGLTGEEDLTPEEREEVDTMRRQMGHDLIRQWKINKSLYDTYGGRIIYQQFGPEPLDAYRKYFEERQQAGDFSITDAGMGESFWQYFTDDSKHDFMKPGGEDAARAFTAPPWE
jgi:heat shock protein HslJ